jgi:hypothetical protein
LLSDRQRAPSGNQVDPNRQTDRDGSGHGRGLIANLFEDRASVTGVLAQHDAVTTEDASDKRQTFRLRVRERPQQHGVDHREHDGVGANGEAQRQDGGETEAGRLSQLADGESEVVSHGCSRYSLFAIRYSRFAKAFA